MEIIVNRIFQDTHDEGNNFGRFRSPIAINPSPIPKINLFWQLSSSLKVSMAIPSEKRRKERGVDATSSGQSKVLYF